MRLINKYLFFSFQDIVIPVCDCCDLNTSDVELVGDETAAIYVVVFY